MGEISSFKEIFDGEIANIKEDLISDQSLNSLEENLRFISRRCAKINHSDQFDLFYEHVQIINAFALTAARLKAANQPASCNPNEWTRLKTCRLTAIKISALGRFASNLVHEAPENTGSELLDMLAGIRETPLYEIIKQKAGIFNEMHQKDDLVMMIYRENGYH